MTYYNVLLDDDYLSDPRWWEEFDMQEEEGEESFDYPPTWSDEDELFFQEQYQKQLVREAIEHQNRQARRELHFPQPDELDIESWGHTKALSKLRRSAKMDLAKQSWYSRRHRREGRPEQKGQSWKHSNCNSANQWSRGADRQERKFLKPRKVVIEIIKWLAKPNGGLYPHVIGHIYVDGPVRLSPSHWASKDNRTIDHDQELWQLDAAQEDAWDEWVLLNRCVSKDGEWKLDGWDQLVWQPFVALDELGLTDDDREYYQEDYLHSIGRGQDQYMDWWTNLWHWDMEAQWKASRNASELQPDLDSYDDYDREPDYDPMNWGETEDSNW